MTKSERFKANASARLEQARRVEAKRLEMLREMGSGRQRLLGAGGAPVEEPEAERIRAEPGPGARRAAVLLALDAYGKTRRANDREAMRAAAMRLQALGVEV